MIKILLIQIFILFSILAHTQEPKSILDVVDTAITYTFINPVKLDKSKLFENAKNWIASSFSSYKDVVLNEDKETGKITCKGYTKSIMSIPIEYGQLIVDGVEFNFTISVKDGKYRLFVDNVISNLGRISKEYPDKRKELYTSIIKYQYDFMIKEYKSKLDSLQKIDSSKLNEKDLFTYKANLNNSNQYFNNYKRCAVMYDDYFNRLNESLLTGMKKNDDF